MTRAYHNLTAHFNVYFNGIESLKAGMRKIDKNFKDDYSVILPIFKYTDKKAAQMVSPEMDRCIQKSAKLIKTHSITVKPKVDKKKKLSKKDKEFLNKPEYCNWIDDGYLMMGQAHYFKQDYFTAEQTFLLIANRFKNEPIRFDAQLWLAKTKIETKNYEDAETLLKELRVSSKTPKELLHQVNLAYADMYLKQENYSAAIKYLEKSIKNEKNKRFKIRLHFILGQIYQKLEKYNKAEANYMEVIKKNYDYEMTFNAKINLAEISEKTKSDKSKLKKELLKMVKDDKNYDYLDQLYYALGRMELNNSNIPKAIEYFSKAVNARTSNKMVKAKSYRVLADYYANKNQYKKAAAYYDSTLASINKNFANYRELYPVVESKSRLMHNLHTIELEDSLQFVARLPEKERNKIIDKQIRQVIENERKAAQNKSNGNQGFNPAFDNQQTNTQYNSGGGKWYFYNPQAVSYGLTNFKSKWGDRELEDLWRLSNKQASSENQKENKENKESGDQNQEKGKKLSNKTREFYLNDLPLTPEKLEKSNKKIEDALFESAQIYIKDLKDDDKGIAQLEKILQRFPETKKRLDVLQMLYDASNRKGDYERSEKYKNLIVSEFPNSINAKLLSDPNFLSKLQAESKKVETLYEEAFNYYRSKIYDKTISSCKTALTEYPESSLTPKFLLLSALAYGESGNKEQLNKGLTLVQKKYPKTEEAKKAGEILQLIESGKFNEQLYKFEAENKHLYVIVAYTEKMDFNKLKFDYLSFNLDNYDKQNLQVSLVKLDDKRDMIVIQSFKNATEAMQYYNNVRNQQILKAYRLIPHKDFVISIDNYKKFQKDQNTEKYLKFFQNNYQ